MFYYRLVASGISRVKLLNNKQKLLNTICFYFIFLSTPPPLQVRLANPPPFEKNLDIPLLSAMPMLYYHTTL